MSILREVASSVDSLLSVCALPVWTSDQLEEVDRLLLRALSDVRQLRNERGTLSPTNRHTALRATPDEVLSYIFLHMQDQPHDEDPPDDQSWVAVLLVCRRWHRVALGTAGLWGDLLLEDTPPSTAITYARRRKTLPFNVWSPSLDYVSSISSSLPSFSHQIRHLVLTYPPEESQDSLHWLQPSNLPNLEVLWLSTSAFNPPEGPPVISLSGFARLRFIDVRGFMPSWSFNPFPPSVRELSVDVEGFDEYPTSSQMRDSLSPLHSLRSFTVIAGGLIDSPAVDRLFLPVVEYVYVRMPYRCLNAVVSFLPIQDIRSYSLYLRGPQRYLRTDDQGLHPQFYVNLSTVIRPRTLSYTSIHISTVGNSGIIVFRDDNSVELSLAPDRSNRFLDVVNIASIKSVYIMDHPPPSIHNYSLRLHDVIPLLTGTTNLTIEHQVGPESTAILLGLAGSSGQFLFPSSDAYRLDWPNLRTLTLKNLRFAVSEDVPNPAIRKIGQILWAIRKVAPQFQTLMMVQCTIDVEEIQQWRLFIPNIDPVESLVTERESAPTTVPAAPSLVANSMPAIV